MAEETEGEDRLLEGYSWVVAASAALADALHELLATGRVAEAVRPL